MDIELFNFLRKLIETEDGLILYALGIFMLLLLIPMSVLLPEKTGFMFLYSIYIGYLVFTFQSLIENYQKVKGNILLFKPILKAFEHLTEEKSNDDKEDNHGS